MTLAFSCSGFPCRLVQSTVWLLLASKLVQQAVGTEASVSNCLHGGAGGCSFFGQLLEKESSHQDMIIADATDETTTTHRGVEIVNGSAAAESGVETNKEGDLEVFLTGIVTYGGACCVFIGFFMYAKEKYPLVYQNNVLNGLAPDEFLEKGNPNRLPQYNFGWAYAALKTPTEETAKKLGMDAAMLLEFTNFCIRALCFIGLPIFFILGPMHLLFGGMYAGEDHLSYLSFGNVENGSWLYWVHPFVIWGVILTMRHCIFAAMQKFVKRRHEWLIALPTIRACTILVEDIPEAYRSDQALKDLFVAMFGRDKIESAYVVKDTSQLTKHIAAKEAAELQQLKAKAKGDSSQETKLAGTISDLDSLITAERKRINSECKTIGGVNQPSGFVQFKNRTDAETALNLRYSDNAEELTVDTPPDAASLRWQDLNQDQTSAALLTVIGYGLVGGLYLAYLPIVVTVTQVGTSIDMGPLQSVWASVAPTLGLQLMVAFLPTFLILIFYAFFTLRADVWAQQTLQNWYFWFQVVFVVMVTAVGSNIIDFTKTLIGDPFGVPEILADTMPYATHFYMNFLVMQWMTHCMNLTRYISLTKFIGFSKLYTEEEAREMAEPEDQDYYGMGSRSARFTINMVIAIVYGTLSPPIGILALINFLVCRLIYGYLMVFAETKKPDTGGVFFVSQLKHLFLGMGIYSVMMTGVLYGRAATSGPAWIAGPSIIYVVVSARKFNTSFHWEKLPFRTLCDLPKTIVSRKQVEKYEQEELK